jgi:hypothetical protein
MAIELTIRIESVGPSHRKMLPSTGNLAKRNLPIHIRSSQLLAHLGFAFLAHLVVRLLEVVTPRPTLLTSCAAVVISLLSIIALRLYTARQSHIGILSELIRFGLLIVLFWTCAFLLAREVAS